LILEGVPYFQVVFTLPEALSRLSLGNRREIYDLLFASSWSALKRTVENEQGYDPSAVMVLHTWDQKLDAHAHVHAVVAGGGPSLTGSHWKWAVRDGDPASRGHYLVEVEELRRRYREAFLGGLKRLRKRGELRLEGDFEYLQEEEAWSLFIKDLESVSWVSYIESPPRGTSSATPVLKYLARYLTGGPISDSRIESADASNVTFMAREGKKSGGEREQVPVTLSTLEFTRRWSLHVLPKGYTKSRRYGGWSNPRRKVYREHCRALLGAMGILPSESEDTTPVEPSDADSDSELSSSVLCPECGSEMILLEVQEKPSWREVMSGKSCPAWYQTTQAD
jgi:hypothetical protein